MNPSTLLDDFSGKPVGPTLARGGVAAIPHVVAWNLTQRCNLACSHCYISAGPWQPTDGELTLAEFQRITDEILELSPGAMFVLTGGEPLVRKDLEDIAAYAVSQGATAVVGTNGVGLTERRVASLAEAGVTGFAVSIDSLDAETHDNFRHGTAALASTLKAIECLRNASLDFIVQTTVTPMNKHEIRELAAFSAESGAVSFNLYFLVETGRGEELNSLSPQENEEVLLELVELQREYRGRMLVRSKCQPQLMRYIYERDPESPLLNYGTRCPCGIQYCRITPDGKLTPCPYLPKTAGDLRTSTFKEIWENSPLFESLRHGNLEGDCGSCEYRGICGGCRARAYARTRNVLATDTSCAYKPTGTTPMIQVSDRIRYGENIQAGLRWSPEAEARMQRIPSFVRGVVMGRVEDFARKQGLDVITEALLDQVRKDMPVDFSKGRPFFLGGKKKGD